MTRCVLRPPVAVLPLPSPEMLRIRVVLARRTPPPLNLPVRIAPVIRLVCRVFRKVMSWLRPRSDGHRPRRHVLTVEGARPPPRRGRS